MTSIIRPSKLHENNTSKWRANSSILTCRRNFDIDSTKLVLVSTQNHCCFNVKFWCCFNVDKMTLFQCWNTVSHLFNVNIKITVSQTLSSKNKNVFMVNPKSTSCWFNVDKLTLFWCWKTVIISMWYNDSDFSSIML